MRTIKIPDSSVLNNPVRDSVILKDVIAIKSSLGLEHYILKSHNLTVLETEARMQINPWQMGQFLQTKNNLFTKVYTNLLILLMICTYYDYQKGKKKQPIYFPKKW